MRGARGLLIAAWVALAAPVGAEDPGSIVVAQAEPGAAGEEPLSDEELDAAEAAQGGPPAGVEVLRVRGRGIAAIETEVPASVTQFDAATIEALGAQDISDLSRVTPNVNIVQPGATQATFFVRGIGLSDFSSNAQGAVAIFQDDVGINAPAIQTGQLFDIEGVDVLRGPQGSGAFRNASGGAIKVRSRRPTGNYSGSLRASLGRYAADGGKGAHHGQIRDYEGALEMPLVDDALSSRFAFRFRDAEPYQTNGCGGKPPISARARATSQCGEGNPYMFDQNGVSRIPAGMPTKVGDQYNWAARGTLRWQIPGSELDLFANMHGSRLDQPATLGQAMGTGRLTGIGFQTTLGGTVAGPGGYQEPDQAEEYQSLCRQRRPPQGFCRDENGNVIRGNTPESLAQLTRIKDVFERSLAEKRPLDKRPYRGDYDNVGDTTRDAWGAFLSAEGEIFRDYDFLVLASFDTYERFRFQDTDFTPEMLFEQIEEDEAWQTYNVVQLGGELAAEPLSWEVGAYYLQEKLDVFADTEVLSDSPATPNLLRRDYSQETWSAGAWAGFSWDFIDDFTLEGGVRYNWERKDFTFRRDGRGLILDFLGGADGSDQDETWQTPTGQIILTYHVDQRSQVYARYTRGFKAGHFNALATANIDDPAADEEYNDAWEAGLRGAWFEGRLAGATSFFYYRYQGYQVFLFRDQATGPPVLEILNAEEAENYGIEVEGRIEPLRGWTPRLIEGLRISGNFGWLHGEYLDFQITTTLLQNGIPLPFVSDFSGKALQNAPQFKVSATVDWTFDLGRWGYLVPRYDLSWEDDKFFDPNEGRGTQRQELGALPEFSVGQPSYYLHNVRLAYRTPTSNVEVAAWVRNLTDEAYKNFAFDASAFSNVLLNFVGEPRTIGVDVSVTF